MNQFGRFPKMNHPNWFIMNQFGRFANMNRPNRFMMTVISFKTCSFSLWILQWIKWINICPVIQWITKICHHYDGGCNGDSLAADELFADGGEVHGLFDDLAVSGDWFEVDGCEEGPGVLMALQFSQENPSQEEQMSENLQRTDYKPCW